jgi:hypothetical protein
MLGHHLRARWDLPHERGPLGEGVGVSIARGTPMALTRTLREAEDEPDLKAEVFEAKVEDGELKVKL